MVALAMLMVSLVVPWWGMHGETEYEWDGETESDEYHYNLFIFGSFSLYGEDDNMTFVTFLTMTMLFLAIIFTALFIAATAGFGMGASKTHGGAMALGAMAMIFCMVAPLSFAVALPGAMLGDEEQDARDAGMDYDETDDPDPTNTFFGNFEEESEGSSEVRTWGGDMGWILCLFATFMIIPALISLYMAGKRARLEDNTIIVDVPRRSSYQPTPTPSPYATPISSPSPYAPPIPSQSPYTDPYGYGTSSPPPQAPYAQDMPPPPPPPLAQGQAGYGAPSQGPGYGNQPGYGGY
jgi:hypothetical protein